MGEIRPTYREGYIYALMHVQEMLREEFPDPNPLASLFKSYVGDRIIARIEEMKE